MHIKNLPYLLVFFIYSSLVFGQATYLPPDTPLPEKIQDLPRVIEVRHFPEVVHPCKDKDDRGYYFWKHNTAILSKYDDIRILDFGIYIHKKTHWALQKSYPSRILDKFFDTEKGTIFTGQPYTFPNNWRKDEMLSEGWALWYFIGIDSDFKRVCGYAFVFNTNKLLE